MDADSWRQAKSVLEAALLCVPAEREALVAARCADPWLRREVLSCLKEHDESFLESALTVSNTFEHATSTEDVEAPPDVQPGQHIAGRYEIIRRLGAGGMGHVFLARDTDLERQVALKFLIAAASAADIRSRIFHEARAAARITHSNIAVVHDVGLHDGRAFLVMEYVEGENLAQILKRERPTLEKILAVGRQLASALAVAHEKGIIHRDLKPANIQLARDGSAKILDFGVAHAMASVEEAPGGTTTAAAPLSTLATLRTERGAIRHPGTPAYMSPEQMFGKPIDGRSDIYSLGVILYEMATGHRPYSTDDPLDVVLALSRNLMRPSGEETHLPEDVNDVIGRMLAVELDKRYQKAEDVEAAFAVLMGRDQALAQPKPTRVKSRLRTAVRVSAVLLSIPIVVGAIGYVTTFNFNLSLSRTAPFNQESPLVWLTMGRMALLAPVLRLTLILVGIWAVRFIVRLARLSKRVDSMLTEGQARTKRLSSTLKLDDPVVMGQGVAAIGLVALLLVTLRFYDVLQAVMTDWSNQVDIRQRIFTLQHFGRITDLRFLLDFFTLIFAVAAVRVARLRALQPVRRGAGALAAVIATLVLTVLLSQFPYRIVYQNKFERVDAAGDRCYIIGESTAQWLLFCPDNPPPRCRRVSRTDSSVRRSGKTESIFSPP
jgi:serine/threonine protein kinase